MPSVELIISIVSACIFAGIALLQFMAKRKQDKLIADKTTVETDSAKALAATNVINLAAVLAQLLASTKSEVLTAVNAVADQLKQHARADEDNMAKVYSQLEQIKFKLPG